MTKNEKNKDSRIKIGMRVNDKKMKDKNKMVA